MNKIAKHKINFYELTFLINGKMEYYVNDELFAVNGGDVLFIQKNSLRLRNKVANANYISINFFDDKNISLPNLIKGGISAPVINLLSAFEEIYFSYPKLKNELNNLLSCVISLLENSEKDDESTIVKQIKQYLVEHITEKITLKDVGNALSFSPIYCDSVFKKQTGYSIINYFIKGKIKLAQSLIAEGEKSLIKIAEQVGFSDYNYFSRTFKLHTNYTPLQYKQNIFLKK